MIFLNSKCTSGICNENLVFGRAGLLSVKYTTDLKDLIQNVQYHINNSYIGYKVKWHNVIHPVD